MSSPARTRRGRGATTSGRSTTAPSSPTTPGGYSFYKSALTSRFLRLRPNSVPMDQPGRYFYLRDAESGRLLVVLLAAGGQAAGQFRSVCRHGTAYTIITSRYAGIETESTYFVPLGQAFEYWRLRVTNKSKKERRLSVFTYCEIASPWVMPNDLSNLQYSQFITKAEVEREMLGVAVASLLSLRPVEPHGLPPPLDGAGRAPRSPATRPSASASSGPSTTPMRIRSGRRRQVLQLPGRGRKRVRHPPGRPRRSSRERRAS